MDRYDVIVQKLRTEAQMVENIAPFARELVCCTDIERSAFLISQIAIHSCCKPSLGTIPIEWYKFREVAQRLHDARRYIKWAKYNDKWNENIQIHELAKVIKEIHQVRADVAVPPKSNYHLLNKVEKIINDENKKCKGKETDIQLLYEFFGCSMSMLREYYEKYGAHRMMAKC